MSSIDKLAIRGIRSFSPFEEQKIDFFKPLTMILGQNGAGKTTIIESLRTMTAGSMPPHTQGGKTFIHDPRMSNQPETKASIKLKFNTIKGRPVFAMRSFQLLNKKVKQEFKKLEQVLKAKDEKTGQEISINKNCAEMDRQVPLLMGVSNAILENVIFCHQEDTLWPFSDQANLKKIFDEIFDTTKYTKALAEMRTVAKKYSKYTKEFKQELDLRKKDFEQYAKLKSNISQYESKIREIKENIGLSQQKKETLDKEFREFVIEEQQLAVIENEVKFLQMQIVERQKQLQDMNQRMGFESDNSEYLANKEQELRHLKENYELTINRLKEKQTEHEQRIDHLKDQTRKLQVDLNDKKGYLASNLRLIEDSLVVKSDIIKKVIDYCQETGHPLKSSQTQLKVADIEEELARRKLSKDAVDSELNRMHQMRIDRMRENEQLIKIEETKEEIYQKNLLDIEKQLANIRGNQKDSKQESFENVESSLSKIQARICQIAATLQKDYEIVLGSSNNAHNDTSSQENGFLGQNNQSGSGKNSKIKQKILKQQQTHKKKEVTLQELKREELDLETQLRQLASKQQEYARFCEVESKIQNLRRQANGYLKTLEIDQIPENTAELNFKGLIAQVSQKHANSESVAFAIQELQNLKQIVTSSTVKGSKESQSKQVMDLQKVKDKLNFYVKEASKVHSTFNTIAKLIKFSKQDQQCYLCKQQASAQVIQGIQSNFNPQQNQQQLQAGVDSTKNELLNMIQGSTSCQKHCVDNFVAEIDLRVSALQKQSRQVKDSNSSELTQLLLELEYYSKQLMDFPTKQSSNATQIQVKGQLAEVQSKMTKDETSLQTLAKQIANLQKEKEEAESKVHELQLEYCQLQAKKYKLMSKSKSQSQDKGNQSSSLQEDLLKLTKAKSQLESEISNIKDTINQVKANMDSLNHVQNEEKLQIEQKQQVLKTVGDCIEYLTRLHMQLQNVQYQIDKHAISAAQREDQEVKILQIEEQLSQTEKETRREEASLRDISMAIQNQFQIEKTIEDFDRFRQMKADVREAQYQVIEKKKLLGRKDQILALKEQKQTDINEVMVAFNKNSGYIISLQDSLRQMKVDLQEERFKDIEKGLLDFEIKYNLTKDIALEVQEKHDALEEAMMKYHHEKMKEINKTLSDFWKMTYKGNDIDTIEIKSDVEKGQNQRIRSYNYRIVLKTFDDTELDMRGRCSAGQKVLSSIIIRLSLAETFCSNCGILALDEPTTNLDAENIEGLANALIEIIESRKKQDSFQLIIITHDEQFVQLLGSAYTEYIWKVAKDQSGYSKIIKKSVQSIL